MANKWTPIPEMDMDDGTHTCYFVDVPGGWVYLTQRADGMWDVEHKQKNEYDYCILVSCKTLTSAKRWAARYAI